MSQRALFISSLKILFSPSVSAFFISLQLFIWATGPMNIIWSHTCRERDGKYVRTIKQDCQACYISSGKVTCFFSYEDLGPFMEQSDQEIFSIFVFVIWCRCIFVIQNGKPRIILSRVGWGFVFLFLLLPRTVTSSKSINQVSTCISRFYLVHYMSFYMPCYSVIKLCSTFMFPST